MKEIYERPDMEVVAFASQSTVATTSFTIDLGDDGGFALDKW